IALSLVLAGCSKASAPKATGTQPKPETSTAMSSAVSGQQPTVVGHLDVEYIKATRTATFPQGPLHHTLVVRMVGQNSEVEYPVEDDGDFALALAPGSYEMPSVIVEAADSAYPLKLPMANGAILRVNAPASGCVYAGQIHLHFGRLPAGTLEEQ